VERLEDYCRSSGHEIVAVIAEQGSGLNDKRKGLARLFKLAREGKTDLVVVEFQERLARFGFTYVERFLKRLRRKGRGGERARAEVSADMLSILSNRGCPRSGWQRSPGPRSKAACPERSCSGRSSSPPATAAGSYCIYYYSPPGQQGPGLYTVLGLALRRKLYTLVGTTTTALQDYRQQAAAFRAVVLGLTPL
jgi:hypothetical protein